MNPSRSDVLAGGCQCGAVRYAIRAPQWTSICHCRMCQRASGQPFMALVGGKAENLRWTRGGPSFFRSSNVAERGFCRECGTPLTYGRPEAGTLSVTLGSLDEPAAVRPTLQNGIQSKFAWLDDLADLPAESTAEWMARAGIPAIVSRQNDDDTGTR